MSARYIMLLYTTMQYAEDEEEVETQTRENDKNYTYILKENLKIQFFLKSYI